LGDASETTSLMADAMTQLATLEFASWHPTVAASRTEALAHALEGGDVLVLPKLAFAFEQEEERFLDAQWSDGRAKNINFDSGKIKGARGAPKDLADLGRMIARFANCASELIAALFPRYAPYQKRARTSFRPQPAIGRDVSWRQDDTRLHVDAFPSRPNRGERILRVFCNVNPRGEDRVWRV